MKIASFNINGYRAAVRKGMLDWLEKESPDVLCMQEIKIKEHQVDMKALEDLGYQHYWFPAEKPGYSGVATISKEPADNVIKGTGMEVYDREGRVLRTDFGDLSIINAYFPSGSSSEERHEFKMQFLKDIKPWIEKLRKERPKLVVCGDYNIVHKDLDIHNPERRDNPSGFRPEERAWLDKWFNGDFTDAWRHLYPEKQEFSWWSYRAGSRQRNKGWRIDYVSVTPNLVKRVDMAEQQKEAFFSDHCPVIINLD
jgi:exodeoxyribonuclease-3